MCWHTRGSHPGLTGHYNLMLGTIRNMNNHGMPWRDLNSQKVLLNASTVGTPGGLPDQYYWILCVTRYMSIIWFRGENLNGF